MRVCGRDFSAATIGRIEEILRGDPSLSRRALSRRVCELLEWRAANGKLKEVSCRKALLELHRHGLMALPAAEESCFQRFCPEPPVDRRSEAPELRCTLEELGEIRIVAVSSRYSKASRIWNGLMQQWHYLGKGPLCGAQIRYLIESSRHGFVGALAFSAAQWRMRERDQYIGWSEAARRAHLHRVVGNSRFLILPSVHVPNLASRVLGLCMARLVNDWTERYGYAPVLAETFVDPRRFAGTCYRAANWRHVGQTAARPTAYPNGKVAEGPKDIYLYPLSHPWKGLLCVEPEVALCSTPRAEAPADWTEEEFSRAQFFDERLKHRLFTLAADFFAQPGELIPQASQGSAAKTKAPSISTSRIGAVSARRRSVTSVAMVKAARRPPKTIGLQTTSTSMRLPSLRR